MFTKALVLAVIAAFITKWVQDTQHEKRTYKLVFNGELYEGQKLDGWRYFIRRHGILEDEVTYDHKKRYVIITTKRLRVVGGVVQKWQKIEEE